MKKAEKDYMSRVQALGCLVCGSIAEIHHIRRFGEKRKHSQIAPLCPHHHRGPQGIHHMGKRAWERTYMTQDELLELVDKRLAAQQ